MAGAVLLVLLPMIACDDTSGPASGLGVDTDSLSFSFVHRRDTADSRQISIDNVGGGDLRWTAEAEPEWLLVEPATGTAPSTVAVRVDTAGLIVGSYMGVIHVTGDNGGADSVIVALDIDGAPPSGISFVRGDTVFLIDPDGGNRRTLLIDSTAGAPRWSPDGQRFVFTRGNSPNRSLYIAEADGSQMRLLVDPGERRGVFSASWPADGSEIVYERYDETGNSSHVDLWIVTVATGMVREFRELASEPAWSPDGEWIAFKGPSGITLRRVDGAEEVVLVDDNDAVSSSWSPDGKKVVYDLRQDIFDWDLYVGEIATGELTELIVSSEWGDTRPVWSPDGRRVLFSRGPAESGSATPRLFTIAPDGSNLLEVPNTEGALSGQWRPWVAPEAGRR